MGMMINRRRVMGGKSLPYDAEIEYLESSGTQWINTGVDSINTSIEVTYLTDSQHNTFGNPIFGNNKRNVDFYHVTLYGNSYYYSAGIESIERNSGRVQYNNKHTIKYNTNNYTLSVDGIVTDNRIITNKVNNDCIYIGRRVANDLYSYMKYYNFKIYTKDTNTLILDLIPVRVGQVGYMYDKVSKQLFGNQGTGAFILGPDEVSGGGKHLVINLVPLMVERRAA